MHIIIGILTALAALFWAFTRFAGAAREGRDAVEDLTSLYRRQKWQSKSKRRLIEAISDPRESASILLLQIALYRGILDHDQEVAIHSEIATLFDIPSSEAVELCGFARVALGELNDAGNNLKVLLAPIVQYCTDEEQSAFLISLSKVAKLGGDPTDRQTELINRIRHQLVR